MLFLGRTHELLGADAGQRVVRGFAGLHAPAVRAYVAHMGGGQRFDTRLLGAQPSTFGAHAIQIVVSGELVLRDGERARTLTPGTLASLDVVRWDERWEGDFSVLVFEWGTGAPRDRPRLEAGALAAPDREALSAFAASLGAGELRGERAAHRVVDALARLRAAGLEAPAVEAQALHGGLPRGAQQLVDALGATLSRLGGSPQLVDLSDRLGVGERQVRRSLQGLASWLPGYSAPSGWRRKLRVLRTQVAASFLTARGTSIEAVARSVGYGSARAMSLAFDQEGLPSPSAFRAA